MPRVDTSSFRGSIRSVPIPQSWFISLVLGCLQSLNVVEDYSISSLKSGVFDLPTHKNYHSLPRLNPCDVGISVLPLHRDVKASLNAQALRRQVGETQRLAAECKSLTLDCESLTQECTRLENECNLYHNDREVFMEVADEAEERAAQAEDKAAASNRRLEELLQELESIRGCTTAVHPLPAESLDEEDVPTLKLQLADLESKLQSEAQNIAEGLVRERNSQLEILLAKANQRYEVISIELKRIQEACSAMETARDELSVFQMVPSSDSAGGVRALEQERDEVISSLNLQFKAILKRMQGEFRSSRERLLKKWTEGEGSRERWLKPWTQDEGVRERYEIFSCLWRQKPRGRKWQFVRAMLLKQPKSRYIPYSFPLCNRDA